MKRQTSGYRLTGRSAGRLAGALGLLLALCLVVGGVLPAYAAQPPSIPHAFHGNVSVGDPPVPVAEGTPVEAYVDGDWAAETTVAGGKYSLLVSGTAGAEVTFLVGGVLAAETATWESGAVDELNLTIAAPPVVQYDLTVDSTVGGAVTEPGEPGPFTYDEGTVVDLLAEPEAGYQFVNWTGDTGDIDDADAADTTITINDDYAITANFEEIPPVPPPDEKLIGADDATPGGGDTGGFFYLYKYTAVATGTCTEIRVKVIANGNVKVAIYADNAGEPGARLAKQDTSTAVTTGWNTISLEGSYFIVSGTPYWIGANSDGNIRGNIVTAGVLRYKAATYSTFTFPDPAGTGFSSYSNAVGIIAGWGSTVAPEKPLAPTRDCTTLTFRWNASAGATNYHLQVNTSADFTGTDVFNGEVSNVTSREVPGLTGNTTYYYRVKAGNAGGWSAWSSTGSLRCGGVL